jgi:excisionase family DNA binding protein
MEGSPSNLLRAEQISERWGCSVRFVYALATRGELPRVVLSRKAIRFRLRDVEKFEEARSAHAST